MGQEAVPLPGGGGAWPPLTYTAEATEATGSMERAAAALPRVSLNLEGDPLMQTPPGHSGIRV